MPTLPRNKLAYGYIYYDATVDDARLVLAVARSAAAHGAAVANRCRVAAFEQVGSGLVGGASIEVGGGRTIDVAAETVVNATGVWTDELRALEELDEEEDTAASGRAEGDNE